MLRVSVRLVVTLLGLLLALSACSGSKIPPGDDLLSAWELDGFTARELVDRLDRTPLAKRPEGLTASVRPDRLVFVDDVGREAELELGEDEFYLSFAPYVEQTHPCDFHSLTTCLGEMRSEEISYEVRDAGSGELIQTDEAETFDNGFYGIWLPRDRDLVLSVSARGLSAEVSVGTGMSDRTCQTDLRLS